MRASVFLAFLGVTRSHLGHGEYKLHSLNMDNSTLSTTTVRSSVIRSPVTPTAAIPRVSSSKDFEVLFADHTKHSGEMDLMFLGVLKNALRRNRAKMCQGIDPKGHFLERIHQFLSYWETDDYSTGNKTERDLLVRLVEYQSVYQTMVTQSRQDAFPDDIVDQVRSLHDLATKGGALAGANARVLDPLDIILDDVCADTGRAKVPRRVQEIVDVILHGLEYNAEIGNSASPPRDCKCVGTRDDYPCGVTARAYWLEETAVWHCQCLQWKGCDDNPQVICDDGICNDHTQGQVH